MKKKLFFSTLCFTLLLIMMLSTTLAWFTDTETNVNTMVAGRVSIEQTVAEDNTVVIVPTAVIPKAITVENDGDLACYVRTLIAFEDAAVEGSEKTMAQYLVFGDANVVIPGVNAAGEKVQYTRDNVVYTIGYYVHGELAVDEAYTCLNTITLDASAPSEWNEACSDLNYRILVLSQAVQVAGLGSDAAAALNNESVFGVVNAENVKLWFDTFATANP